VSSDRELEKWYLEQQILKLEADNAALREALTDISEYWNGDANINATTDACYHARDVSSVALAADNRRLLASPQPEPKEKP